MLSIKTRKIVNKDCQKMYKITALTPALDKAILPEKYFTEKPYCYSIGDSTNIYLYTEDDKRIALGVDYDFPESDFLAIMRQLKQAGYRLHIINNEKKELEKEWQGEEVFIFLS